MNVLKIKKIIRFLVMFIISFTFLTSIFGFVYMESYNKSEIAKYNSEEMNWRDFCLSQNPPGGTVFGFSMIAISVVLVLVMSILALLKIKILYYDKYILFFFAFLVFLSYSILIGAWFGIEPQFYNCIGFFN